MGRSKAKNHVQPNEFTCGPASLKTALDIIGRRVSLARLIRLCRTTKNGTSVKNLIKAVNSLGHPVMAVEWATLHHLQSALKTLPDSRRAVILNYQEVAPGDSADESGHYATVAGFSSRSSRVFLFDTINSTKKKSYKWTKFIDLWYDYDFRRVRSRHTARKFRLSRKYYNRLLLVVGENESSLPRFTSSSARLFLPASSRSH